MAGVDPDRTDRIYETQLGEVVDVNVFHDDIQQVF